MARAHSLLADGRWRGADLGTLVRDELAAQAVRVDVEGSAVQLGPEATQPLAMALHELAANAAKHGALSTPSGRVKISWRIDDKVGGLTLRWEERGGPPVAAPPERRGFGSRLLGSLLERQLGGSLALDWTPTGLHAELVLPPQHAKADRKAHPNGNVR
jgi:two-component sensor histidine kinase